ncbi:unnamed protein product [Auanema sp. JU1783]|nr:unnamed protein product [Auanema sp. JU1783]
MSGGTPRKFSEKIAIMERKQNEDVNNENPTSVNGTLHPPSWPQIGGSLPNVANLPSYSPGDSWQWESRKPVYHPRNADIAYHPYRGHRSPERVPPLHFHYASYSTQETLQPPETWHHMNRARSDPALNRTYPGQQSQQHPHMINQSNMSGIRSNVYGTDVTPGPSEINHCHENSLNQPNIVNPVLVNSHGQMLQSYHYNNGSPMQSPQGSPMGSSLMLDERNHLMELSPPAGHAYSSEVGSLPNLEQMPPACYHTVIGPRHSTGGQCGRLVPTPVLTPESQSAPTSPHNVFDTCLQPQWPAPRTFSNSPESLDIPKLVLTNPEGTHGSQLECFNDLQHLTLDSTDINYINGSTRTSLSN